MEIDIELPHLYHPRTYQKEVFVAYNQGIRRFVLVWHRRSGKDKTMLNFTICRMFERVGMYWYVLPTYEQARLIIWEGMGSGVGVEGMPFLDHFPEELVEYRNEQRLEIGLANGSIFRLIGSDHVDRIVGANPVGVVYSEYSLQSITAWEYISPMLTENKGWAAFIYTPRGRNHAFALWEKAMSNKTWFVSTKTIEDTYRDSEGEDGSHVVHEEDIAEERLRGMDENLIQQEYYCSFVGFREGSYYGQFMASAYKDNRIRDVPWNPRVPVFTVWDLGIADQMAIWWAQVEGREIFLIDYHQENAQGLVHYISLIKNKPYVYSNHWAPSDINQREMTTGRTRIEIARDLGINFRVVPSIPLMDGIEAARAIIPRCYFDKNKCDPGIRALINYHKDFNNKTLDYKFHPVHDKWSHGSDAFRYLAIIVDKEKETQIFNHPPSYIKDFSIFESEREFDIFQPTRYDK